MGAAGNGAVVPPPNVRAQAIAALTNLQGFLNQINQATCEVNLVKSTVAPTLKNTRNLDMTLGLAAQFKASISNTLQGIIANALATPDGVAEFNFQAFADGRLAALPVARFPEVVAWLAKFPPGNAVQALGPNDNHVAQLKFIHTLFIYAPNGEVIRVFRRASEARVAKHNSIIAAKLAGASYDYVNPEESLIFDMQVDFFIWDNTIFMSSYKQLESILNFREITMSVATAVCDQLLVALPVTNGVQLKGVILSGARHLNKLAGLRLQPHLGLLNMAVVQNVIASAHLPLTIINVNGVPTLNIDPTNPLHIKAYMHILGDDYVQSMMTALQYIGTEKEPL